MRIFNKMNRKNGFTLIEALVATVILLITASAFLTTLIQYSTLIATGFSEDIALSAVQQKLEEIVHDPTHVMDYNDQSFAVSGLTAPSSQAKSGLVKVTQVSGTNDLFDITVTVDWLQRDRPMSRTLTTTLVVK